MRKLLLLGSIFLFTVGVFGWRFFSHSSLLTTTTTPNATSTEAVASHNDLDIGMLFMIGHWSNTPVASTTQMIATYGFGGVIIMDAPDNPHEIKNWTKEWNDASETSLLIAIDQEGGPVTRLKGSDFIKTGQRAISTEDQAYDVGYIRGKQLADLGINMNFAPVLDTATNPSSFMYDRTFPDTDTSPILAAAMIHGMASAGIVATPKHFPGHDDTNDDSHLVLPEVMINREDLDKFTSPFRTLLADDQPKALMTAHVRFPLIDTMPATLSNFFLTTYLRDTLGYTNVIITDDMSMDAIDTKWTATEASLMALEAGADILLFAAEPTLAIDVLTAVQIAATTDSNFTWKLHQSERRISNLHN